MSTPLVSFIIPVLNGEKFIGKCLSSIRNQHFTVAKYEIIVLDNGSTDRTCEIVESYGLSSVIVKCGNVASLRNKGAKIAQGQYVAFIDSDIELSSEFLSQCVAMFGSPEVVACGCIPGIPKNATWVQQTWSIQLCGWRKNTSPVQVSWLGSAILMVRRKDFESIGGFNENLETAEDVDLCYRLGERGKILSNPSMRAIHWGEPPDLLTFWRKEVWRGLGNIQGIASHGFRLDELPSIGYPIYCLIIGLLLFLGGIIDFLNHEIWFFPLFMFLFMAPAFLLAGYTTFLAKDLLHLPQLFFLYLLYGCARGFAIVKSFF